MTKITLALSRVDWAIEVAAALAVLATFAVISIQFDNLPSRVPIHFNVSGTPDGYGSKTTLISLPIIALFLYGLLTVVNKYPHAFNYTVAITDDNRERQYRNAVVMLRVLKAVIAIKFMLLTVLTTETAKGNTNGLSLWYLAGSLVTIFGVVMFFVTRSYKLR